MTVFAFHADLFHIRSFLYQPHTVVDCGMLRHSEVCVGMHVCVCPILSAEFCFALWRSCCVVVSLPFPHKEYANIRHVVLLGHSKKRSYDPTHHTSGVVVTEPLCAVPRKLALCVSGTHPRDCLCTY